MLLWFIGITISVTLLFLVLDLTSLPTFVELDVVARNVQLELSTSEDAYEAPLIEEGKWTNQVSLFYPAPFELTILDEVTKTLKIASKADQCRITFQSKNQDIQIKELFVFPKSKLAIQNAERQLLFKLSGGVEPAYARIGFPSQIKLKAHQCLLLDTEGVEMQDDLDTTKFIQLHPRSKEVGFTAHPVSKAFEISINNTNESVLSTSHLFLNQFVSGFSFDEEVFQGANQIKRSTISGMSISLNTPSQSVIIEDDRVDYLKLDTDPDVVFMNGLYEDQAGLRFVASAEFDRVSTWKGGARYEHVPTRLQQIIQHPRVALLTGWVATITAILGLVSLILKISNQATTKNK